MKMKDVFAIIHWFIAHLINNRERDGMREREHVKILIGVIWDFMKMQLTFITGILRGNTYSQESGLSYLCSYQHILSLFIFNEHTWYGWIWYEK